MLWNELTKNPHEGFLYLERYVNSGSPSGFSVPFSKLNKHRLDVPVYLLPNHEVVAIGAPEVALNSNMLRVGFTPFPVHPRFETSMAFPKRFRKYPRKRLPAFATASLRTLSVEGATASIFIKLHYPWIVGRFRRDLQLYKLLAAAESARLLREAARDIGKGFGFFDEFASVFYQNHTLQAGFGTIFRSYPQTESASVLIPAFALFSADSKNTKHPLLLEHLLRERRLSAEDAVKEIVEPIIHVFILLAAEYGLLPEWNAQNLVLAFDQTGRMRTVITRDMEDLWRDYDVLHQRKVSCTSLAYHSISRHKDVDYYKRRSFMYDFKLGEYVITPLLRCIAAQTAVPMEVLIRCVRSLASRYWRKYPHYFAHDEVWYSYPRHRKVGRTSYIEHRHPQYR